ncbi:MAG: hypothetical protein H6713_20320 [Myxococcales bacterium]|nr:hypothetical protein [Myxococcales bacterium]
MSRRLDDERALAPFEEALAREYAEELAADVPAPDLLAALERARELKPARVPQAMIDEVGARNPVVSLRLRARGAAPSSAGALDEFVTAYRAEVDDELRRQRVPPRRERSPSRLRRRLAVAVGLAAAVALTLSTWRALESSRRDADASWQAENVAARTSADARATSRREGPRRAAVYQATTRGPAGPGAGEPRPPRDEDDDATDDVDAGAPASTTDDEAAALGGRSPTALAPDVDAAALRVRETASARDLRSLDRAARAHWQAGELRAAERAFRELIERGGRDRLVELAFGDLFTLSRQIHGEHALPRLWREYLARFPRGRYADDARAGLCTRASGRARARCWARYLRFFPDGSHSADARRHVTPEGRE